MKPVRHKAKRHAKKRKRAVQPAQTTGGVAGATAVFPSQQLNRTAETQPSQLAAAPQAITEAGNSGLSATALVLFAMCAFGFALALLAAIPTQQLVALPGSRWIARRRLDFVIFGMGIIAAVVVVLFITEALGP